MSHTVFKAFHLFRIGAGVFLIAGCAATNRHSVSAATPLPAAVSSPADKLWVISAVFGTGGKWADVTDRVDDLLHQPSAVFYARAPWLGVDPNPGWNKTLVIVYEFKGQRRIFTTNGGKVSVQELIHNRKRSRKKQR